MLPQRQQFLVRLDAGGTAYWAAFPMPGTRADDDAGSRALAWSLAIVVLLLAAAFAFARYLARPLRQDLEESGASELLSANVGCRLHLDDGKLAVRHPLELLSELLE